MAMAMVVVASFFWSLSDFLVVGFMVHIRMRIKVSSLWLEEDQVCCEESEIYEGGK